MRYSSPQFMMPQCDEILGSIFGGSWITSAASKIVFRSNRCAIEVKPRLTFHSLPPTCCRYHKLPIRLGQLVYACAHLCPLILKDSVSSAADYLVYLVEIISLNWNRNPVSKDLWSNVIKIIRHTFHRKKVIIAENFGRKVIWNIKYSWIFPQL